MKNDINSLIDKIEELEKKVSFTTQDYDYYYLESLHNRCSEEPSRIETLVIGLSYGVDGIDSDVLPNCYNFAMHSQDIYYDKLHVEKLINQDGCKISTCVICWGYYSLFYDLSLSTASGIKIPKIYNPLFHDLHNLKENKKYSEYLSIIQEEMNLKNNDEIKGVMREMFDKFGSKYYGAHKERLWTVPFKTDATCYAELTGEEKDRYATIRATKQNKFFKYSNSFMENAKLFVELANFLQANGVRICVCIMPFTKRYMNIISPLYKQGMVDFLDRLETPIDFIDMNEQDDWGDEYFYNSDHLTAEGATRATTILSQMLEL